MNAESHSVSQRARSPTSFPRDVDPSTLLLAVSVVLVIVLAAPSWTAVAAPSGTAGLQPNGYGRTSVVGSGCAPAASTSPSSILIPLAPPSGKQATIGSGSKFGAQFEFQATKLPPGHSGTSFYIPSMVAVFHLSGGGTMDFFFVHRSVNLAGGGWSAPVSVNRTLSSSVTFSSQSGHLTSNWLAVMANASYGTAQIQFQWQWWSQTAGKPMVQAGPWSHSINTANTTQQPTTFFPAPLVGVVGPSASSGVAGQNYTLDLKGNVSATKFRMVIESPTGKELNSVCLQSGPSIATFNASIPLTYSNGTNLPPGNELVHLHNAAGAVVVFAKVAVT